MPTITEVKEIDDVTLINLIGIVDTKSAPDIQSRILETIHEKPKIIINMSEVTYLSSAGLRLLLLIYREEQTYENKIVLSGLSEKILEIMDNTGFIRYFTIVNSVEEGIKKLNELK